MIYRRMVFILLYIYIFFSAHFPACRQSFDGALHARTQQDWLFGVEVSFSLSWFYSNKFGDDKLNKLKFTFVPAFVCLFFTLTEI